MHHVYTYYSKIQKCYSMPKCDPYDPERMVIETKRACLVAQNYEKVKDLKLIYLGLYDDETGLFVENTPKVILDCETCAPKKDEEAQN